jgi:hypothetical protein
MIPSDLTEESLIAILLDQEQRQQLTTALAQEQGTNLSLTHRYEEIAPRCQATPEMLRRVAAILRTRIYRGTHLLDALLFHPQMPDDLLLDLAHQRRWVTLLAHRSGPRTLLEYIAERYQYSEAITTLAVNYYPLESDETFVAFIAKYRTDALLYGNLKRSRKLSAEKRAIVQALSDELQNPLTPRGR